MLGLSLDLLQGSGKCLLILYKVNIVLFVNMRGRVGYAVTFWENNAHQIYVSWRFSIAIILVPCIIFASGLPFLPET